MPDLTCILVSPRGWHDEIAGSLNAWRRQTIASRTEVLLLGPGPTEGPPPSAEGFHSLRWIPLTSLNTRGEAAAEGIRQARSPWVALQENHAFPGPEWAEKVLEAVIQGGLAGACGRYRNANPDTLASRTSELLFHWAWLERVPRTEGLPWHNVIYRRELLMKQAEPLEHLLEPEQHLQVALAAQGHRFGYVAEAEMAHLHPSTWKAALETIWYFARQEVSWRAHSWPLWRRRAYALAWPLLMARRAWHVRDRLRACVGSGPWWAMWPAVPVMVLTMGLGEAAGFAWGADHLQVRRMELELNLRLNPRELEEYRLACRS